MTSQTDQTVSGSSADSPSVSSGPGGHPHPSPHAPEPEREVQLSAWNLIGLVSSIVLLGVAWYHSFAEIWQTRWFPTWNAYDLSLWERMTNGESYYTHGPLVPLICLGIAWYIYHRVGLPARRSLRASITGWFLLIAVALAHMIGVYARVKFLSGFCLIGMIGALILLWGGFRLLRAYWVPVLFLVFMVPLPMNTISELNIGLKFFASRQAVWATNHLFGIASFMDGAYVHLPQGDDGIPKRLVVENVCGGLRSLIALIFFASLFAVVCRVKGSWRIFMLLMAVPVAIACNVIRITGLNVVAHHWGLDAAREGAWFHDLSGVAVFVVALVILFTMEGVIILLNKWLKQNWVDERLLPYLSQIPAGTGKNVVAFQPVTLLVLAVIASFSVYFALQPIKQNISQAAYDAIPPILTIGGDRFVGQDMTLEREVLRILETEDYLYRKYTSPRLPEGFDVLIIFSTNIRNGAHAPEVCLEAAGHHIVRASMHHVDLSDVGAMNMRNLITQRDAYRTRHVYVFKAGDSYTTSYFRQQASIFFNGLINRNTAGALIRFTVPLDSRDEELTQKTLDDAIQAIMPHIERGLP